MHSEVSRAVDKDSGELVALKKMSITLPGEANQKEGVSNHDDILAANFASIGCLPLFCLLLIMVNE